MNKQTNTSDENKKPQRRHSGLIIIAIVFTGIIFLSRQEAVKTIDCDANIIARNPDVVMLGAWWCSYCNQAKRYFQKNNIDYCEYDMESTSEGRRLYQEHGGGAVPIILIGEYQLRGFNKQQVEAALETLKDN